MADDTATTGRRATTAPSRVPAASTRHADVSPQPRERILDAAETLFAAHGFDGASTARLARAADVPKGLLFYYFPTKIDILTTLLKERLGEMAPNPADLTVPGDPEATLVGIGEHILRTHASSGTLREIIWHESHTRPEVQRLLAQYRHGLHDAIEQALSGSIPFPVPRHDLHTAATAWEAVVTARPLASRTATALHSPTSLRAIAALLARGLLAEKGPDHP